MPTRRTIATLFAYAWVAFASGSAGAARPVLSVPVVDARSYLVLDVTEGRVLAQKEADQPQEPASLTKLMTAYVVFDALKHRQLALDQRLPISERAWKMPGSRMFIDPKMKVPVEDLIRGLVVQSGNDAAVALAEGVGGTVEQFVDRMNAQAKALGMTRTRFRSPEGLPTPGHVSTARDLGLLATRLLLDFPQQAKYFSIRKYHYAGTPISNQVNRNALLFRDASVDGFKTGYTDAAGYCIVASAKRPTARRRDGTRLLVVVLGAASESERAEDAEDLLNWGFRVIK